MSGTSLAQPDITLTLDIEGIIQSVRVGESIGDEHVEDWRGRPWFETVGDSGGGKIRRMVDDARRNGVSAYSQFTQRFPSGREVPMEFTTVRLGPREGGAKEGLLAIGRSLQAVAELQARLIAAQQAMEQDYWKLREVETRYRLLFDAANDAVLLVKVDTLRVLEANPAAIRALGVSRGSDILAQVAVREQEPLRAMLARVREQGRAPGALVHIGPERRPWTVRASLMTAEGGPVFILQLVPVGAAAVEAARNPQPMHSDLVENLPDGFVVVDEVGVVRHANRGFLDIAQLGARQAAIGERLGRWLARPGADAGVLLATLQRHGSVRRFATTLQGELGSAVEVEISAARHDDAQGRGAVLLIRDVGSRALAIGNAVGLRTTLSSIIEQTGRSPLPTLIGDAVSLVEEHCVRAALEMAGGNRTEAAELLGLSRQSLYKKVARYGLEGVSKSGQERSDA